MLELLITRKSIAIIFDAVIPKHGHIWKIAFGTGQKKVLPQNFLSPNSAVKESRRLGFGGYRLVTNKSHTKTRVAIHTVLAKDVEFRGEPTMFFDEKKWRLIYKEKQYAKAT